MAIRSEEARGEAAHRLRREVSPLGLMFVSLGSIIGSGWLFGALYASQIAGPAALIAWVGGGLVMMLLALVHAELGSMYPVAGGSARYPHFSFGSLVGFAIGWIVWVGAVTVAPIEVEAAMQYLTHYFTFLTSTTAGVTVLTTTGIIISVILMAVFTVINLMGILSAISTGGIIFAYQGFEQAIQLGGESRNPTRNIPLAVIGAMVIGVILYVLLQVAFLGALHPAELQNGWAKLSFPGAAGPFAGLATAVGAGWLATLLYIDAAVSPAGTGLIYTASSSRLSFALGRNHYIPHQFGYISDRGVPLVSIIFSFIIGCIMFLPFPGWQELVGFITSATVMGYATVPLAFGAMRRQEPDHPRPFKLPAGEVLAPLAFIVANLVIYWTGWTTNWKLFLAIALGYVLLGIGHLVNPSDRTPTLDWRSASWLWPYFIGMALLSYLGPTDFAGIGVIPFGWDILVVAIFSLAIYYYAVSVRLTPDEVRRHVADAREETEAEEQLAV